MQRRHFIHTLSALAGGMLLAKPELAWTSPNFEAGLQGAGDEEAFWALVREQFVFPRDYVYLNTGGIGATPILVLNRVKASMDEGEIYPSPGHDQKKWLEVKEKCAGLLSPACTNEELALVSTATEGINIVISGLPLKKGDEVITSTHEHPALHVPLLNRLQRDGIVIRAFEPDLQDGLGNVARIERLINRRTRLIFISHVTCTTGQRFPIKDIGQLANDRGLWFALDGAQAAGAVPMDIAGGGVDFYAFSGHKWTLGPKRTGALYVRKELLEVLRPTTVGAYSDDGYDIHKMELTFQPTAQRYEYATQNEALFHGLGRAIDFVNTLGLKRIAVHNKQLAERFYQGLETIPGVQILSPAEKAFRTSMITFKIKDKNYREIGSALADKRIRVRQVWEAGLEAIRVSFHVYNNADDVEVILNEIKAIATS